MHLAPVLTILAVGALVAAATETVVQTLKTTRTMVVTHCADSYADCPFPSKTSAVATNPVASSSAAETSAPVQVPASTVVAGSDTTISVVGPTGGIPGSSTAVGPLLVPTGAAGGLRARRGAAAVALAVAVAAAVC